MCVLIAVLLFVGAALQQLSQVEFGEVQVNDGCDATCRHAWDNVCDDGGPGAQYSMCALGTDCYDCGRRDAGSTPLLPSSLASITPILGMAASLFTFFTVCQALHLAHHRAGPFTPAPVATEPCSPPASPSGPGRHTQARRDP